MTDQQNKLKNVNDNQITPIVSVLCQAYNHGEFIEQCLNGIMNQETSFSFEVLIHDDASTDNTADIIRRFELQYPGIIKPIYQTVNQYSQNKKVFSRIQLPRANFKYIAICEGDDYWTNTRKLQKQIDFLEANEDFAICHHNMKVVYEDNNKESHLSNSLNQKEVTTIEELSHGNYIYTASCVFRNKLFGEFPDWFSKCPVADYPLHMLNAQFGKIRYFPEVMGVYRVHKGGVWENKSNVYRCCKWVDMLGQMKYHFTPEINMILSEAQNCNAEFLATHFKDIPEKCKHYSLLLLENDPLHVANLIQAKLLLTKNLDLMKEYLQQQNTLLSQKDNELGQLTALLNQKSEEEEILKMQLRIINEDLLRHEKELDQRNREISAITESRAFKPFTVLRVLINFFRSWMFVNMISDKLRFAKSKELIRQSKMFDEAFYLQNNPDIKSVIKDPVKHYLLYGGFEGRKPSPDFDSKLYLEQNPDVKNAGMNPLLHYAKYGKREGRQL